MPPIALQTFYLGNDQVQLFVPDAAAVQNTYRQQKESNKEIPFPYWTQVWPASLGLATFIVQHPEYIANKKVLELAAGLGLPSLIAARKATSVYCTDYLPEAVATMEQSVAINNLHHVTCGLLNWHQVPNDLITDVLLLSDINYDPMEFDVLYQLLLYFLQKGCTILLSTPQRLMAKPFLESLQPWINHTEEVTVTHQLAPVTVSILVLQP